MSVSTQYAPSPRTPFSNDVAEALTEYLTMENYDRFLVDDSTKDGDKYGGYSQPLTASSPQNPSSSQSIRTDESTPPSAMRSTAGTPHMYTFDDHGMEHMWNDFSMGGGEDSPGTYRGLGVPQTQDESQMIFATSGISPMTTINMPLGQTHHNPGEQYQFMSPASFDKRGTVHSPLQTLVSGYQTHTQALHGQITPVDDNQHPVPVFPPDIFQDRTSFPDEPDSPPSSRRGSISPKSSSRRSRKSTKSSKESDEEAQEAKRRRFLERNRVAASKCRLKKKQWMQSLEENARHQQTTSRVLQQTVAILKDELLCLKQELLKHHGCNCTQIRTYLMQEAEKVVVDQQRKGSVASDQAAKEKARQLSIAESERSEISGISEIVDDAIEEEMAMEEAEHAVVGMGA